MLYIHSFTGDGSTKLYSIPSRIINERHVEVYVNVTGGTITNSNLLPAEAYDIAFNSIVFKDAPTKGATIQVRTATNPDELLEPLTGLQAVAASLAQIQEVADNISGVIATSENIDSVNVVADNISGVIATGENIDSVNVVATNISGVIATGENIGKVNIVGMDLQGAGYSNVIDMGFITDPAESLPSGVSNIETVADNIDSVNVVATNISGVIACARTFRAIRLNDIQDVEANGTAQDGDILRYNATTQRYELYKLSQLLENVDMGYIS